MSIVTVQSLPCCPPLSLCVRVETYAGLPCREVVLTDWLNGRQLYRWKGHTGTVNRLAFSPDSKLAFSGARCALRLICIWQL